MVEGLVHISAIGKEYFYYNADIMAIVGETSKKIYRLGDQVRVKVTGASKQEKQVDFEIVGGEEENGDSESQSEI